jgi:WD40 repeat protein
VNPADVCAVCGTPLAGILGVQCPRCLLGLGTDFLSAGNDEAGDDLIHIRRFGDYELLEEVARGGMGVVYRARQISLDREVAVKMILAGELAGPESLKMFRREAHAAANLYHPNIVPVYEIGEHELQHYFTMRLVPGGRTVAHWAAQHRNEWREIASVVAKIARAVGFAHQHGVLHRDLKPSNILWDDAAGPQVTDFGLAKLLGESDQKLTLSARILGSPHYMAPEQAGGRESEITTATDVYGLGAVLYELLGGKPPFSGSSAIETLRRAVDEPPQPLPQVPADLQTICFKALEKEPNRRYRSADSLADDLERWLRDEPIHARPATTSEQLRKWVRRRPVHAALLATATLSLIVLVVGQIFHTRRTNEARRLAEAASRQLAEQLRRVEWQQTEDALAAGKTPDAMAAFARFLRETPDDPIVSSRLFSLLENRAFPLPLLPPLEHGSPVSWARMYDGGGRLLTISGDGVLRSWNLTTGAKEHETAMDLCDDLHQAIPDGRHLVARSKAGRLVIWDCMEWTKRREIEGASQANNWAVTDDGGRIVLLTTAGRMQLWDTASGRMLSETNTPGERTEMIPSLGPSGEAVVYGLRRGVWLWRPEAGSLLPLLDPSQPTVSRACDWRRQRLYAALAEFDSNTNVVVSIDLATRRELRRETSNLRWNLARSTPDAGRFVMAVWGDGATVINTDTLAPLFPAFGAAPLAANISVDGRAQVGFCALHDGTGRLYDLAGGRPLMEPVQHGGVILSHELSPDGTKLVTASQDGTARLWDVRMRTINPIVVESGAWCSRLVLSHDRRLLLAFSGRQMMLLDAKTGLKLVPDIIGDDFLGGGNFSPDDRYVVAGCSDSSLRLVETGSGRTVWHRKKLGGRVWMAVFSPDGRRVACTTEGDSAWVFDTATGEPALPPLKHTGPVTEVNFSPDGSLIATASTDSTARLWSAVTGEPVRAPYRHLGTVWGAVFSPDGTRLITASSDRTAQMWDVKTGEKAAPAIHADQSMSGAIFTADGRRVLVYTLNSARLYDAATSKPLSPPMRHGNSNTRILVARLSPDNRYLYTGSENGTARVWDIGSSYPVTEPLPHYGAASAIAWHHDSRQFFSGSQDGRIRHWVLPTQTTAPQWLPELAEALAGKRELGENGSVAISAERLDVLRRQALDNQLTGPGERWLRWFLVDRMQSAGLRPDAAVAD